MRSTRPTRFAVMALGLASLAVASDAAAQILVLRATGPVAQRMRAGTLLPPTRPIRLAANETLELLSETSTWTWRGPGDFPAAARAMPAPTVVAPDRRRARIGAVRGTPGSEIERPNLWIVDILEAGAVCVPAGAAPVLWRADADEAATTTITVEGGDSAEVQWEAGQDTLDWPEGVPMTEGAYRLTNDQDSPVEIRLRTLETLPETAPETGIALIERGCEAQLDLLAARMEPRDELAGS